MTASPTASPAAGEQPPAWSCGPPWWMSPGPRQGPASRPARRSAPSASWARWTWWPPNPRSR
ncbi:hypothetical protein ACFFX0_04110 [Citricoccus parietis]|uniref:Uncharacterized protein n=1 Tax=Citricoccus parietis TaxID=592307 RepID=A0ABV5FUT3_9MICC